MKTSFLSVTFGFMFTFKYGLKVIDLFLLTYLLNPSVHPETSMLWVPSPAKSDQTV